MLYKVVKRDYVLICVDCWYVWYGMKEDIGPSMRCPSCGSTDVIAELEEEDGEIQEHVGG